jgi:hypothetical protein
MEEDSSMLKPWRDASIAIDITALFLATILITAILNCSGGAWREHCEIMWLNSLTTMVTYTSPLFFSFIRA